MFFSQILTESLRSSSHLATECFSFKFQVLHTDSSMLHTITQSMHVNKNDMDINEHENDIWISTKEKYFLNAVIIIEMEFEKICNYGREVLVPQSSFSYCTCTRTIFILYKDYICWCIRMRLCHTLHINWLLCTHASSCFTRVLYTHVFSCFTREQFLL